MRITSDTQKIQSFDWPKCCVSLHNIISHLFVEPNIISDGGTNGLLIRQTLAATNILLINVKEMTLIVLHLQHQNKNITNYFWCDYACVWQSQVKVRGRSGRQAEVTVSLSLWRQRCCLSSLVATRSITVNVVVSLLMAIKFHRYPQLGLHWGRHLILKKKIFFDMKGILVIMNNGFGWCTKSMEINKPWENMELLYMFGN